MQKTLRNDAVRDQKRVLAVAHDTVREVSSVERGHDVELVAETMRVNAERVALRRESW